MFITREDSDTEEKSNLYARGINTITPQGLMGNLAIMKHTGLSW
jgi:hypothetical protein